MAIECTSDAIASPAECFTCQPEKRLLGMEVYLLAQIALAANPGMDISADAIANASNCYTCKMSGKGLLGAAVYLLCQIANGGGSPIPPVGTQDVFFDSTRPAAPTGPAISYPQAGGRIAQWNGSAWV